MEALRLKDVFVLHDPLVFVFVGGRPEFPWDFAPVDLIPKLGYDVALFPGLVDKTDSELDLDSIEFLGADPASNTISTLYEQVRDAVM